MNDKRKEIARKVTLLKKPVHRALQTVKEKLERRERMMKLTRLGLKRN